MLEKSVKIHNRFQIEMKLGYKIKKNRERSAYDIDTYFFIPNNLGINRETYSKDDFYNDIHGYIRLKTPTLLLRQIVDGECSPFPNLRRSIDTLVEKRDWESRENYEYHVQMLCNITKSALRDHIVFIRSSESKDLPELIEEFIHQSECIISAYRALRSLINVPTTSEKSMAIYRFGDEFISQSVELHGFKLLKRIDLEKGNNLAEFRARLVSLIKKEAHYRVANGFHPAPSDRHDNEVLIYRRGVLKKYIGSVLFLDANRAKEGRIMEQVFISVAAGLSMVFATLVAFYAQREYGNFTMPFFAALVVSYIFKDRIKELSRHYFVTKIRKFRFDRQTHIYSNDNKIGIYKDGVNFIEEVDLPPEISKIRRRDHITNVENRWKGEQIIFYRKRVSLLSRSLKQVFREFNIEGVNDIIRFNINRFLVKMDNPVRRVSALEGDRIRKFDGNRVYHINLIIKITRWDNTYYNRYRLILSRDGLKRIETVQ